MKCKKLKTTYVDDEGNRRWDPAAVCPVHDVPCCLATLNKLCPGRLYDDKVPCRAYTCGTCKKEVPWAFGAGDRHFRDCDDCAVKKFKKEDAA